MNIYKRNSQNSRLIQMSEKNDIHILQIFKTVIILT